jgi:transglutaminase superfamily protein
MRRFSVPTIRAASWTVRALLQARRQLRRGNFRNVEIAPPPLLPAGSERGVHGILRRVPNTCLERSLVLQRWLTTRSQPADVVIGVARGSDTYHAHAWLDGAPEGEGFHELVRLPAP